MKDIVKRLRDPYERGAWGSTLSAEAADEIDNLRAALERKDGLLRECRNDGWGRDLDRRIDAELEGKP
jgi:hypothetical protein